MVNYIPDPLDSTFAALADPTRRAILAQLTLGESAVSELAQPFDMSLPAISKHLRVLENAGLLAREKDGRVVRCRLEAEPMRAANEWLERYQRFWRERLDALAQYLDHPEPENATWPPTIPSSPRSRSRASTRTRARKSSAPGPTRRR